MNKRKVILVTDGDRVAKKAIEIATSNIGGSYIEDSAGNPTKLTGQEIVKLVIEAPKDPVVVMVDDKGRRGIGKGEIAMLSILNDKNIDVLGVVAVSSHGKDCGYLNLSCSVTKTGEVVENAVDKYGNQKGDKRICGDTLSVLKEFKNLVIVGMGDPGKMDLEDNRDNGAPVTTKALLEVIKRGSVNAP